MSRDNVQKKKELPYMEIAHYIDQIREHHVTVTKKESLIGSKV